MKEGFQTPDHPLATASDGPKSPSCLILSSVDACRTLGSVGIISA